MRDLLKFLFVFGVLVLPPRAAAQSFPTDDAVLRGIWAEGMERSQVDALLQTLLDSLGPRLTGTPGLDAAADWVIGRFAEWGIPARKEDYGTWPGWRRGITHVDLIEPRVRSLNAMMLAWSPGTPGGRAVEGPVMTVPDLPDSAAYAEWMQSIDGSFVAVSFPQPSCRPDEAWREFTANDPLLEMYARFMGARLPPTIFERMNEVREAAEQAWSERLRRTGIDSMDLHRVLEEAGAAGILTSSWPQGYGAMRVFDADTERIPSFSLSCEDYGLVTRLAEHEQGPVLRVQADAEFVGDVPTFNTIAEIRGTEMPDEYVVLSAHFDSWDGGSGATDNGTGTVTMMEAARLLRTAYPNPKRTVIVGLWNSEEQGLNGSRAFVADHPRVMAGLQAVFNQDNGTGLIDDITPLGVIGASQYVARWVGYLPDELKSGVSLQLPGSPSFGESDHAAFNCAGAPAFSLRSAWWDYFDYTWHTNLDTYDKVVIENVRRNAVLTAMLAYLAADEPELIPRAKRNLNMDWRTGQQAQWPQCVDGDRTGANR